MKRICPARRPVSWTPSGIKRRSPRLHRRDVLPPVSADWRCSCCRAWRLTSKYDLGGIECIHPPYQICFLWSFRRFLLSRLVSCIGRTCYFCRCVSRSNDFKQDIKNQAERFAGDICEIFLFI